MLLTSVVFYGEDSWRSKSGNQLLKHMQNIFWYIVDNGDNGIADMAEKPQNAFNFVINRTRWSFVVSGTPKIFSPSPRPKQMPSSPPRRSWRSDETSRQQAPG